MKRSVIAGRVFKTKKDLKEEVRRLLYLYDEGQPFGADDFSFLIAFFEVHPRWEEKRGDGVAEIFAAKSPEHVSRCFWLRRVDGSAVDISFTHCMRPSSAVRRSVMYALRRAVRDQVRSFRSQNITSSFVCPLLGIEVDGPDIEVDHKPPATFLWLAESWARLEGYDKLEDIPIERATGTAGPRLAEKVGLWQTYHEENADLRLISKLANGKRLK